MDYREDMEYVPLEECVDHGLYRLSSRNLSYGVYNARVKGFVGVRFKIFEEFLFTEYHWDYGDGPYGTVKPLEFLEMAPLELPLVESNPAVCSKCGRSLHYGKVNGKYPLEWQHSEDGTMLEEGATAEVSRENPLFDYLKAAAQRHQRPED